MDQAGADVTGEVGLVEALRAGDELAFAAVVERYHPTMLRVAAAYVPSPAVAEEVVQETWLGVLDGLDRFEGRASLRTWIFRILVNVARTKGKRESRSLPFSSVDTTEADGETGPFLDGSHPRFPDHWAVEPVMPESAVLMGEALAVIRAAIDQLTPAQRAVIALRDEHGWSSREVCNVLDISETNQRVLLHRARSRVRSALEPFFGKGSSS